MFDTIIIGAGLAGLSAAYELNGYETIILESTGRVGGRVFTKNRHGVSYELGAIFAFDKGIIPFDMKTGQYIKEEGPIGIGRQGKIHFGKTVFGCIEGMCGDGKIRQLLVEFLQGERGDLSRLPDGLHNLLNAFFRLIHPGVIDDYIPQRRKDALVRFIAGHYEDGNEPLVREFLKRIQSSIRLHAQVVSVEQTEGGVIVTFEEGDILRELSARTAIVTTPAPVTARILKNANARCRLFLNSLQYGHGTSVVLGLHNVSLEDFSYLVLTDSTINTVIRQKTLDDRMIVLTVYSIGDNAIPVRDGTRDEALRRMVETLSGIGIGPLSLRDIVFFDSKYWDYVGPFITEESYGSWNEESVRPSERIFLSGDYTFFRPSEAMPYGMSAAILSGKEAAEKVIHFLAGEANN